MRPVVLAVVQEVAKQYGLDVDEVLGRARSKTVARARCMAMWLTRVRLDMSYPEIGREFDRDHTTVMSAVRGVERWLNQPNG